jgi:hypothetical protein
MGNQYTKGPHHEQLAKERLERAFAMAQLYQQGSTLAEIGTFYGITRERVRQLMTRELGIRQKDGGKAKRSREKAAARQERMDVACLRRHGMTRTEFLAIKAAHGDAPIAKFRSQRNAANWRGIEWRLTFAEWWRVWQESGKWAQRARATGYVMARHGDRGPYAIGNIKIITAGQNNSEYIRRFWSEVRAGKRPPPKGGEGILVGMQVGETRTFPITQKRPTYAANHAWGTAKSYGWKVKTSTKGGVLTVTRIS